MRTFTIALLAMLPVSALGQVTINDVGGTNTANGLRVVIGNAGQFQVIREATANSTTLAVPRAAPLTLTS
jgi:hypothetical protein